MKIQGKRFQGEEIELDGNDFEDCSFSHCRIKFSARAPFTAVRCEFHNIKWVFGGPAAATLSLFDKLIQSNPDYGRSVLISAFPQLVEWLSPEARERLAWPVSPDE